MKLLTPIKAIRANCIECSGGSLKEVRECNIINCPLWAYRMGRRPDASTRNTLNKIDEEKGYVATGIIDRKGNDE